MVCWLFTCFHHVTLAYVQHFHVTLATLTHRSGNYVCMALWTEKFENECFAQTADRRIPVVSGTSPTGMKGGLIIIGLFGLFGLS